MRELLSDFQRDVHSGLRPAVMASPPDSTPADIFGIFARRNRGRSTGSQQVFSARVGDVRPCPGARGARTSAGNGVEAESASRAVAERRAQIAEDQLRGPWRSCATNRDTAAT